MPTFRIYYDAFFDTKLEAIELKMKNQLIDINTRNFKEQPGFLKREKIFLRIFGNYYLANYIDMGSKIIPSITSEIAHFNLIEDIGESEEKNFPVIIKIIFNKE